MKALQAVQDIHHALERVDEQVDCVGMPSHSASLVDIFFPQESGEDFACNPHKKNFERERFDGNTQKRPYSPEAAS